MGKPHLDKKLQSKFKDLVESNNQTYQTQRTLGNNIACIATEVE